VPVFSGAVIERTGSTAVAVVGAEHTLSAVVAGAGIAAVTVDHGVAEQATVPAGAAVDAVAEQPSAVAVTIA
jgi:hypothetical protein